jgi:hypothetical protein
MQPLALGVVHGNPRRVLAAADLGGTASSGTVGRMWLPPTVPHPKPLATPVGTAGHARPGSPDLQAWPGRGTRRATCLPCGYRTQAQPTTRTMTRKTNHFRVHTMMNKPVHNEYKRERMGTSEWRQSQADAADRPSTTQQHAWSHWVSWGSLPCPPIALPRSTASQTVYGSGLFWLTWADGGRGGAPIGLARSSYSYLRW